MSALTDKMNPALYLPDKLLVDELKGSLLETARSPVLLAELYFRLVEIGATVGKHTFRFSRDTLLGNLPWAGRKVIGQRLNKHGRRLVNVFEDLGPTFIKIGQVLSTRPDLISERIAAELRLLQDKVAPFAYKDVKRTIEEDFRKGIKEIFTEFEKEPVASASVAQVHRARDYQGNDLAVKVQRPAIYDRAKKDLLLLRIFFASLERVIPHFRNLSTHESVREIGYAIERQLDFRIEADNCDKFIYNFRDEAMIEFPRLHRNLCTSRVLTMDFIEGAKGDQPQDVGADPKAVARLGLRALVKMVFVDGFLHCDPHPGNIFILPDGKVVFIDLGLAAELPGEVQQNLMNLIVALVQGNVEQTAKMFLKTCDKVSRLDMKKYTADIEDLVNRHLKTTISQMEATMVFKNLFDIVWKHNLKLNSDYALVFMALITVEGLGKRLDPDLDLMAELQSIMASLMFGD